MVVASDAMLMCRILLSGHELYMKKFTSFGSVARLSCDETEGRGVTCYISR